MALTICPECQGKVSSKSEACIHCGFPMKEVKIDEESVLSPPELPHDLTLEGFFLKDQVKLLFVEELNVDIKSPTCVAVLDVLKNGIRLRVKKENRGKRDIHFSQITSFELIESSHIAKEDKSLLGRALVGGVLLGGVGAVLGGMTGFGSKSKSYSFALKISYYCPISDHFTNLTLIGSNDLQRDSINKIKDSINVLSKN